MGDLTGLQERDSSEDTLRNDSSIVARFRTPRDLKSLRFSNTDLVRWSEDAEVLEANGLVDRAETLKLSDVRRPS